VLFDAPAVLPALLTPFDDTGRIDRAALREHVEFVIEGGVDGILACGTTGETALLEDDEVLDEVAVVVEAAKGRVKVIAHVGRPSTRATQRLIERAVDVGADAVAAIVPYYYSLEDTQIVAHFRALIETAAETPLFAYTFPARTGNHLAPEALRGLAGDGLAGLKDSTGDRSLHVEYLEAAPNLEIFVGSPTLLLGSLRAGSRGSVAALANLRPDLIVALVEAFSADNGDEAERLQDEIVALEREIRAGPALVGLKLAVADAMAPRGVTYPARLRSPLGPVEPG
jgi:dihydrodipicolinate synthase/N-acetylneuraminate lyase